MKVLALSDIHGAIGELENILNKEDDYDLILLLGDITDTSEDDYLGTAREAIELAGEGGRFVKAVPGNMDNEDVLEILIENRVNLHKNIFSLQDYDFVGFGGGRTPPGVETPFEPEDGERGEVLEQLIQRTKSDHRAVVSHEPPKETAADVASGEHVGSDSLRKLIGEEEIDLVLCGHIHESRTVDEVEGTTVVNPGPVKEGRYAVLELEDEIDVDLRG
ncbi:MAG: metallophosphoesterase family protein [Candidatus Nanohaloarchaea archaeon]|nr:metallophosphoesterase family protein [Candidatus Nanohaloarchaea archaeon]